MMYRPFSSSPRPFSSSKRLRGSPSGFTLIELLIVVLIISVVTSVGLLTIGRNSNRDIETFSQELSQKISLAEERAMLQREVLGIYFDGQTIVFATLDESDQKNKIWTPLQSNILGKITVPDSIELKIDIPNLSHEDEIANLPQIIISTNGDPTPFKVYIGRRGKKPHYVIMGDASFDIENKLIS